MDSKKILETLVKIAHNQQKIIHKLAQVTPIPTAMHAEVQHQDPTKAIISALGTFYTTFLTGLSVNPQTNTVEVSFKPGQATQANYDHVLKTVQTLQTSNILMGGPYKVSVAG
jgi:hypothetical protein